MKPSQWMLAPSVLGASGAALWASDPAFVYAPPVLIAALLAVGVSWGALAGGAVVLWHYRTKGGP